MSHEQSHWGQKITESRPLSNLWLPSITTVLHLRYTHAQVAKKKKNLSSERTYEEHLSAWDSRGSAEDPSGRERWNEEKKSQRKTKGDSSSSGSAFMSLAGAITVGTSSANLPGPPQLLHLTHCSFPPLYSMMAIAEGLRKFGDCWAKTDHFKAAYLTLAKFFITVA